MSRVEVELQKSVRIRSFYTNFQGQKRVSKTGAYTTPHTAATAYAHSSTYTWAARNGLSMSTKLVRERERKVYAKVRPYFDRLFSTP